MSTFNLNDATLVIVGAWNIAILDPQWIVRNALQVPPGTKIPVEMEVSMGIATNFRSKINDLFFMPSPDKFIINPSKENEELFRLADSAAINLYKTLSHTPIQAIGYNFTYILDADETYTIDITNCAGTEYPEIYKKIDAIARPETNIQHSLLLGTDDSVVLNIHYNTTSNNKLIKMNYHYQVNKDAKKIDEALGRFNSYYQHSKLMQSLLIRKEGN